MRRIVVLLALVLTGCQTDGLDDPSYGSGPAFGEWQDEEIARTKLGKVSAIAERAKYAVVLDRISDYTEVISSHTSAVEYDRAKPPYEFERLRSDDEMSRAVMTLAEHVDGLGSVVLDNGWTRVGAQFFYQPIAIGDQCVAFIQQSRPANGNSRRMRARLMGVICQSDVPPGSDVVDVTLNQLVPDLTTAAGL